MEDRELRLSSGWLGLGWVVGLLAADIGLTAYAADQQDPRFLWAIIPLGLVWVISLCGFVVNGPNQARVVQLFGTYVGTVRQVGFFYGNPFYWRPRLSLRVRTFETGITETPVVRDAIGTVTAPATMHRQAMKVNDKDGTPIEITAVVAWRVVHPAAAVFQVDDYEKYVRMQADAALRNLASRYSYDAPDTDTHSLRGHIEEVAGQLKLDLQARMHLAGVEILEARISNLAYAPEIAAAMLQRQQAGAVVAARAQIVTGAVGIVEHALELLQQRNVVELDAERKVAMVSNLLVVLCGHTSPQPVLNTGTLYN